MSAAVVATSVSSSSTTVSTGARDQFTIEQNAVTISQRTITTNTGDATPIEEEESTGAYLSGFRPPSPTNVIQLLDRIQFPGVNTGPASTQMQTPHATPYSSFASPEAVGGSSMSPVLNFSPIAPLPKDQLKVEVRVKKLGAMRKSDAEMVESVVPQRGEIAPSATEKDICELARVSTVPFIVPTLFKHFHFYPQPSPEGTPSQTPGKKNRTLSNLFGSPKVAPVVAKQDSLSTTDREDSTSRSRSKSSSLNVESPLSDAGAALGPGATDPSPLMRTVVDKSDFNLSASEHSLLLRDLIHEYVDIYFENTRSFSPYYKKRHENMSRAEQAKMIYTDMKHETQEKVLQTFFHNAKPKLVQHLEYLLEEKSLQVAKLLPKLIGNDGTSSKCLKMMSANNDVYLAEVNKQVSTLRDQCMQVFAMINARLVSDIFPHYDEIPDQESLNERVLTILFEPDINIAIKQYHAAYHRAASTFPGRILLSPLFRNRIESRSYHDAISFNDLVVAVEESTGQLRSTIHGFIKSHPDLLNQLLSTPPAEVISSTTPDITPTPEILRLSEVYRRANIDWLHESRIYTKLFTPATTSLLKKLRIQDPIIFRMISENKFQAALWRLLDLNCEEQAHALEDWMTKYVLQSEFITASRTLGGGFTTTKIVALQPDDMEIPGIMSHAIVYGVFKPKPKVSLFSLQSMKDGIVSNHRKEVAAYRIDRMLHLHHVPLTKSILYEEHEGSIQYFINDVVSARDMNEVNIAKPKRAGKFQAAKGERAVLSRSIRMFDWLIDNRDRNLDNYLISTVDQRFILIDHSWTWNTPGLLDSHAKDKLNAFLPNQKMYERCKFLLEHPQIIDQNLQHLLSSGNIDTFKQRLGFMVKHIQHEIEKHGEEAVFKIPNAEDKKTFDLEVEAESE